MSTYNRQCERLTYICGSCGMGAVTDVAFSRLACGHCGVAFNLETQVPEEHKVKVKHLHGCISCDYFEYTFVPHAECPLCSAAMEKKDFRINRTVAG